MSRIRAVSDMRDDFEPMPERCNRLEQENADLRAKLEAAEREKEEIFGQGIVLIQKLEREKELAYEHFFRWFSLDRNIKNIVSDYAKTESGEVRELCEKIEKAQSERLECEGRLQAVVDALEAVVDVIDDQLGGGGYVPEFEVDINEKLEPWASIFDAQSKAQAALKAWREGRGE